MINYAFPKHPKNMQFRHVANLSIFGSPLNLLKDFRNLLSIVIWESIDIGDIYLQPGEMT